MFTNLNTRIFFFDIIKKIEVSLKKTFVPYQILVLSRLTDEM
jgi:hypothetical protein